MHLAQAQLRAIESGRYIVRSANTGISAIISATGQITDIEPALDEGYCINETELRQNRTLYSYVGNIFVFACVFFTVGIACTDIILKLRKKEQKDVN